MKTEVFLDAAYAIALSVPKDSYHIAFPLLSPVRSLLFTSRTT
jgi:hypothetical protein